MQTVNKNINMNTAKEYVFWVAYAALMLVILAAVIIIGY